MLAHGHRSSGKRRPGARTRRCTCSTTNPAQAAYILSGARSIASVRVNAVNPGPIDTPLHNYLGESHPDTAKIAAAMVAHIPVGRIGRAEEVAAAVTFFAADEATFLTGVELTVNGGMTEV